MEKFDNLKSQCWDKSFYAFATASIFDKRAKKLKRGLNILTFLGIVIPAIVGFLFLSFDPNSNWSKIIIVIASVFLLSQLIISIWSLVSRWDDKFAYALESTSANQRLSNNFKSIAKNPPQSFSKYETKYELLRTEDDFRNDKDNQQLITEKEKRFGHRSALRQFERECSGCHETPTSLESTKCNICGNY